MKRPELKKGDLVKYSKRVREVFDAGRDQKFIVDEIYGDSTEGFTQIICLDRLGRQLTFSRRWLWKTGYNVLENRENTPAKIEEECKVCHKMKDIGNTCWWCGC